MGAAPGGPGVPAASGTGPLVAGGALGATALSSLAAAAKKRKGARQEYRDPYWFYVETATAVYGIEDYTATVTALRPGTWYLAKATYDEWVHVTDADRSFEGWTPGWAVHRQPA